MRTRDAIVSDASIGSTSTPAIGLFALGATELATPSTATLRKSTTTVSGSGRVATYATGSVASITSDAPFELTRALIVLRRTPDVVAVRSGPAALTSAPAASVATSARPLI